MNREVTAQLELIERMIDEGRRSTQRGGWQFVLWGLGYLAAAFWSMQVGDGWPWGVLMPICAALTFAIHRRQAQRQVTTGADRALGGIWWGFGISMGVAGFLGGGSGTLMGVLFDIVILVMMGGANFASGIVLRWPLQLSMAGFWWAAAGASMFLPPSLAWPIFIGAILLGNVGFGLYCMWRERRELAGAGAA
jgi:hypothetical protein